SGPAVIPRGKLFGVSPVAYSLMAPAVVIRPILLPRNSVNHSAPSGPTVMPSGSLFAVGMGCSLMPPAGGARAVFLVERSANHRAPSGPRVMSEGPLLAVGILRSVIEGGSCARAVVEQPSNIPAKKKVECFRIVLIEHSKFPAPASRCCGRPMCLAQPSTPRD